MNKIIKFIKNNVYKILGILLLTIFLAIFGIIIFSLVYNENPTSLYGTRLADLADHPLDTTKIDTLKTELMKDTKLSTVTYNVQGKIINIVITVADKTLVTYAKGLSLNVTKSLSTAELAYYDVQIFITSVNKEDTNYPVIGYRHHTSLDFVWTNK